MSRKIVRIRPDGTIETIGQLLPPSTGDLIAKIRVSRIEPSNPILRIPFRVLRWLFGESGRVSEWTRKWSCSWRVDLRLAGGPLCAEVFPSRDAAIAHELVWLNRHGWNR